MKNKFFIDCVLLVSFVLFAFVNSISATCNTPIRVAGTNPAAIIPGMNQLRTEIGGINNGVGGTYTTGYRQVDWDITGMPNSFPIPRDYYNDTFSGVPKGLILDGGFDVTLAYVSGNTAPLLFGDIDSSYSTEFQAFSSPRLLGIAPGTPDYPSFLELTFFIPGTKTPATVNGFGVVFTDVDQFQNATVTYLGTDGLPIITPLSVGPVVTTPPADKGLSFVSVSCSERIARVRIKIGQKILSSGNTDTVSRDMIAIDDIIYSEPIATGSYFKPADFAGDGFSDYVIFRNGIWWRLDNPTFTASAFSFGLPCDIPVNGDFDGDNRADYAIFRPPGSWFILPSSGTPPFIFRNWGLAGDIPITGDYNADGKTDITVWRPGTQSVFYVLFSPDFLSNTLVVPWGTVGDFPFVAPNLCP